MNYEQILNIGNIVFYCLLGISVLLLLYKIIFHIFGLFPAKRFALAKKDHKFAIIIPARNESKVIGQLLNSIEKQDYNKDLYHTYVVVESESDPTCQIAKKFLNTEVFIRKHLERKGKGYALDEVLENILSSKEKYEAYFIFDADNVLYPNYLTEMNKCFDAGYEMALGYRNSKNWNDGWVASCSALTFSMINTFQNKCRSYFNKNVIISGTGFYISDRVIRQLGGWRFFTLTEDYEISMYAALNSVKSTYNEYAEFYDEQPTKLKVSWNQRMRWVKGFSQTNKKYSKKLLKSAIFDKENRFSKLEFSLSILPIMVLIISLASYLFFNIVMIILGLCASNPLWTKPLVAFLASLGAIYTFLVLYTMVMLLAERKHINIRFFSAIECMIMSPFYMFLYIPIFINSLFKKEVEWIPIEHKVNINIVTGEKN